MSKVTIRTGLKIKAIFTNIPNKTYFFGRIEVPNEPESPLVLWAKIDNVLINVTESIVLTVSIEKICFLDYRPVDIYMSFTDRADYSPAEISTQISKPHPRPYHGEPN